MCAFIYCVLLSIISNMILGFYVFVYVYMYIRLQELMLSCCYVKLFNSNLVYNIFQHTFAFKVAKHYQILYFEIFLFTIFQTGSQTSQYKIREYDGLI
jgi:hypothetical protein